MDKIIQLPLAFIWWHDIEKWRIRHTVEVVERPTEDAALENIYYAARLARGARLGTPLSELERSVYRLERQVKLMPAYSDETPFDRAAWVYDKMETPILIKRTPEKFKPNPLAGQVSGVRHVMAILNDISYAMRGYAQYEAIVEYEHRVSAVVEVLHDVAKERFALKLAS